MVNGSLIRRAGRPPPKRAEILAAAVPLNEGEQFARARNRIRDARRAPRDEIDRLVECLVSAEPRPCRR
jgi:hypothetical protein